MIAFRNQSVSATCSDMLPHAAESFKVTIHVEPREDGGLRVWSEDVPELVLSHPDASAVLADIPVALRVILSEKLGAPVQVLELLPLPGSDREKARPKTPMREFAALAA